MGGQKAAFTLTAINSRHMPFSHSSDFAHAVPSAWNALPTSSIPASRKPLFPISIDYHLRTFHDFDTH